VYLLNLYLFIFVTVLHLFLWIVTWLFLTLKMTWKFKLRVTVGRAAVHNAKSIKLVNDIELHHQPVDKENAPMLIVGFGKTFTVHDPGPKKLIMKTLARAAMETDKVNLELYPFKITFHHRYFMQYFVPIVYCLIKRVVRKEKGWVFRGKILL
jgi:hypothetical protein